MPETELRKVVVTSPARSEGPEGDDDAPSATTIDPDIISADELQYLAQLSGLLDGNPRSLKRFVNTYRLVKTALSDVELAVFLESLRTNAEDNYPVTYSPYRLCMAQLAVLCTQRTRALSLVRHVDQATPNQRFEDWLTQYETIDEKLAKSLRTALREDLERIEVATFQLWLERTRRYSFYL